MTGPPLPLPARCIPTRSLYLLEASTDSPLLWICQLRLLSIGFLNTEDEALIFYIPPLMLPSPPLLFPSLKRTTIITFGYIRIYWTINVTRSEAVIRILNTLASGHSSRFSRRQ